MIAIFADFEHPFSHLYFLTGRPKALDADIEAAFRISVVANAATQHLNLL